MLTTMIAVISVFAATQHTKFYNETEISHDQYTDRTYLDAPAYKVYNRSVFLSAARNRFGFWRFSISVAQTTHKEELATAVWYNGKSKRIRRNSNSDVCIRGHCQYISRYSFDVSGSTVKKFRHEGMDVRILTETGSFELSVPAFYFSDVMTKFEELK